MLQSLGWELCVLALPTFAVWRLWNSDFAGFPNIDGWDGGTHAFVIDRFINDNPAEYFGFVAQYSFAHWAQSLGFDGFWSVALSFHFAIGMFAATIAFVTVNSIRQSFTGRPLAVAAALLAVAFVGARLLDGGALIALHYLQGMGFYPQVFALVGLCTIWVADALIKSPTGRAVGLVCGLGFLRYCYGLNLGDAAAAVALVCLVDVACDTRRAVNAIAAVGAGVAAYLGFDALEPLFSLWGGLAQHSVPQLLSVHLCLLVASLVAATLLRGSDKEAVESFGTSGFFRAVRFPLAFAAANAAATAYFQSIATKYYYINKYQFLACCMLVGAAVVIASHAAGALVANARSLISRTRWQTVVPEIMAALVVFTAVRFAPQAWKQVFFRYVPSYEERVDGRGPVYSMLRPLSDRAATRKIVGLLAKNHATFGGYLTNNFPFFSFMNGSLGYHTSIQAFFPPDRSPGHCVFWVSPEHDAFPNGPAAELENWRAELSRGGASCETYRVRWKPTPQSLCHKCF
ncbi:MAG: hypothetical protein SF187_19165 [Deltaproteobacteria bacterium]|nr:hypothetical protein [Deltaproteobacteria bacterium]